MNKVVYKYPLKVGETNTVEMPKKTRVVHVADQNGTVSLWAEVDTAYQATRHIKRVFVVYGTGHAINPEHEYVGTAHIGPFVWHVYEVVR